MESFTQKITRGREEGPSVATWMLWAGWGWIRARGAWWELRKGLVPGESLLDVIQLHRKAFLLLLFCTEYPDEQITVESPVDLQLDVGSLLTARVSSTEYPGARVLCHGGWVGPLGLQNGPGARGEKEVMSAIVITSTTLGKIELTDKNAPTLKFTVPQRHSRMQRQLKI